MRRGAVVSLCLCAAACAASTNLVNTWRDPAYTTREVKRVLVIGVTPNAQNEQIFEQAVAARLERIKVEPYKAYDVLPRGKMAGEQEVAAAVRKLGIDVVLVTRVVAVRTEAQYVPTAYYAPPPAYYGMYPYYAYGYTTVYAPGYVTQTQSVYLETNAYDIQAQKLVWSGLTRTFDYSSIDDISASAAKTITNALLDQGIL